MKGFPLHIYKMPLHKIGGEGTAPGKYVENLRAKPELFIDDFAAKMQRFVKPYEDYYGRSFDLEHGYRDLRLPWLRKVFTEEEIVRLKYHSTIYMENDVMDLFDKHYQYSLFRKIRNSMWRWGMGSDCWNHVVDVYNAIRRFSIDLSGFEVRLDYTTGTNERGYSQFSRTYLDGVFAYLIYYKGKHVMTLGFTAAAKGRILINQVQLANKKGNRFLYKLPYSHVSYLVDRFCDAFDGMKVYLVNGEDLANQICDGYRREGDRSKETFREELSRAKKSDDREHYSRRWAARSFWQWRAYRRKVEEFEEFILAHLARTYRFHAHRIRRAGRPVKMYNLRFHRLVANGG